MESNNNKTVQIKYQAYSVVALILMLTGATAALHQFKVPMIMGNIGEALNMGGSVSWLMSAFTFTGILLAIPAGGITQKIGPKTMMIIAPLIVALGSIMGGLSSSGEMLIASRAIEGIGFIFISVAGPMSVAKYVAPESIGAAMGIWAVWVPVGQIVAFNLTPILFNTMSWNTIWFVYAALSLLLSLGIKFMLKVPAGLDARDAALAASQPKGKLADALKNKDLLTGAFAFATFNYALMAVLVFLPGFAGPGSAVNMSKTEVALVATIPMIGALVGSPIIGALSDKMGRRKLYMLAIACTGIGSVLAFVPNRISIYAGTILIGLIGLGTPAMILSSVGEIMKKPELMGYGNGFLFLCQNLGMFLGSATFMAVVGILGGSLLMGGVFCLVLCVVGVILAGMTKIK